MEENAYLCTLNTKPLVMQEKILSLILALLPATGTAQSVFPINVDVNQTYTNTQGRKLNGITLSTPSNGAQRLTVDNTRVYNDCTATRTFYAKPGEEVNVSFAYSTEWMNGYVYIDLNGDGQLTPALVAGGVPTPASDLVSYSFYSGNDNADANGFNSKGATLTGGSRNVLNPPAFTLPQGLPEGDYKMRFKVDWNSIDPAGDTNPANGDFMQNGGAIVDATLRITQKPAPRAPRLHFVSNYGFFVGGGSETGLPDEVPATDLVVRLVSPDACYKAPAQISLRTVDADGVKSAITTIEEQSAGLFRIPAEAMQGGDVWVEATFEEPAQYRNTDLRLAFSDEFTGDDRMQPDKKKWKRADHDNNSAWNRYISTSDKVVFLEDGTLVTRCIPCPEEDWEANKNPIPPYDYRDWMSGAVDTRGLYSFRYGRVDVRSLTNPFTGSFPAIWLLPDDQSAGWPQYGEIDIWEMVNTAPTAHGTIHAARESQYTGNTPCNYDGLYHVYTLEWNATQMKWSIDGKEAYSTLNKGIYSAAQLSQGYWPFDKKYYLILNQSVGMGGWAAYPVAGHEYETRFDFVRIYQTARQNPSVGIDPVPTAQPGTAPAPIHDLQGRLLRSPHSQAKSGGIYIQGGRKLLEANP